MKKQFWFFATILTVLLAFSACEKNEVNTITDEDLATSEDATTALNLFQDTEDEVDYEIETRDPSDN